MTRAKPHPAFTLVEMLAVLAIISIIMGAAVLGLRAMSHSTARQRAIREVIGWCERARAEALASGRPTSLAFAVENAPEEYRYRAYAMYQTPPDGGGRVLQSAWQRLPTGISFRDLPESLIRAPRTFFPARGDQKWACPFIEFDPQGRVSNPGDSRLLRLVLFEGFTERQGVETFTGHAADGGPVSETVTFSRATGRVRYVDEGA